MSVIALVGFVAVVLIVLGLIHLYIWWRAVRSTTRPAGRGRRIGTWLIVAAFLLIAAALVVGREVSPELAAPLAWLGYSWLGFAFYFFLLLVVGELIRLGVRVFGRSAETLARPAPSASAPASAPTSTLPSASASATIPASNPGSTAIATVDRAAAQDESGVRTGPRNSLAASTDPEHRTEPTIEPPTHAPAVDSPAVSRRLFLSRSIALGAGVAAAGVAGYGMSRALGDPVVRRIPVQVAGLDTRLAGFRIAMFSDAHLGAFRRKAAMEQLVDTVNGTEPDMVAVLGDLVDGSVADLGDDVAPMSRLQSPNGSFFVTGNHEYYSGVQEWTDYLPDLGVRVLANERVAIERDGAVFDLAGVNDITGEEDGQGDGPDFAQALEGRRGDRPVVLLAHQPVTVDRSVEFGVDLQLSGHTHGGQLWPFDYVISAQQGAVSGLSRIDDTQLYVTSGAGFWGPPMRVGADPEVTVIELYPEDAGV